jgi:hypothetical protein
MGTRPKKKLLDLLREADQIKQYSKHTETVMNPNRARIART